MLSLLVDYYDMNRVSNSYVGLSDAEGHYALMEDPFIEYERLTKV